MVTGALYHTDIGVVLALLSNKPDKPHGVPKDVKGRTAKLGYVFYKKTIGTKSRIDLYLLEDGKSAVEDISLTMTREVPIIDSDNFEGYKLTQQGLEEKFQETIINPNDIRPVELFIRFIYTSEYRENHIPDVHDVLWSVAGQLELKPTNHVTPIKVPSKVLKQLQYAIFYDVLCYYDYKLKQRADRAEEAAQIKADEEAEKKRAEEQEAADRANSFDFMGKLIDEAKERAEQEEQDKEK
ncbi:hypothetical protein KY326_00970 [Candidatus Woesearchaeota archaeon]|nr:hypothetical protein [Candidatus Woesearchaeota archaeon]